MKALNELYFCMGNIQISGIKKVEENEIKTLVVIFFQTFALRMIETQLNFGQTYCKRGSCLPRVLIYYFFINYLNDSGINISHMMLQTA